MKNSAPGFALLLLFLSLFVGCPSAEDSEIALEPTEGLVLRSDGKPVAVVNIDPGQTIEVSTLDSLGVVRVPAAFSVDAEAIRVAQNGTGNFAITGVAPGGMGIVRFYATDYAAELRVFVRNWKREQAYRVILDPDPENYPFCPETPYDSAFYGGPHTATRGRSLEHRGAPFAPTKWAAYRLIVDRGWHYESPSGFSHPARGVHEGTLRETAWRQRYDVPHIHQVWDDTLERYVFRFNLYAQSRDLIGFDDRQRLELKTMDNANHDCRNMRSHGLGETFTFRWKFKLPSDFRVSREFTHLFQLKNEGDDAGNPVFTLTGRARDNDASRDVMQLIYRGPRRGMDGDRVIPSANWVAKYVPLDLFRGEWVSAEVVVTYDNPGDFRIRVVRVRDMRMIMEFAFCPVHYNGLGLPDPFMTFRPGNRYARPKFGLYRRIVHMVSGSPDLHYLDDGITPCLERSGFIETFQREFRERGGISIWFADIEMDRLREGGIVCTVTNCPCSP